MKTSYNNAMQWVGWTSCSHLSFGNFWQGHMVHSWTRVAKHFSLFQNHSLSWAKLQNVTVLHCAYCSGQIVDMTVMQQLKTSEEGCPRPVLLCNWLLYFQAKVKFHKKWNTNIKITSQLKIAISIGNSAWKKKVQGTKS